jgi:predicted Zn-dependent protease
MSRLPALLQLHEATPADPDLHFMIANEHVQQGQHAEALPWLDSYVKLGTDVGAGYALMATCHSMLGDTSAARLALEQGIPAALRAHHPTLAAELRAQIEELD